MNSTIMQPTISSIISKWYYSRSETFSLLCGEDFTHGEVLKIHLGIVAMLLMGAIVNGLGTLIEEDGL